MMDDTQTPDIQTRVLNALRQVVDPELGINIVDLGLVYGTEVRDSDIRVRMTMTTPACPMEELITGLAHSAILAELPNVRTVEIELVWDPPWRPEMMSGEAKRQLGR